MTVLAIAVVGSIFRKISPDPLVQEVGTSFCHARFLGIFPMVLMASYKSFYDGIGRVRIHQRGDAANFQFDAVDHFLITTEYTEHTEAIPTFGPFRVFRD